MVQPPSHQDGRNRRHEHDVADGEAIPATFSFLAHGRFRRLDFMEHPDLRLASFYRPAHPGWDGLQEFGKKWPAGLACANRDVYSCVDCGAALRVLFGLRGRFDLFQCGCGFLGSARGDSLVGGELGIPRTRRSLGEVRAQAEPAARGESRAVPGARPVSNRGLGYQGYGECVGLNICIRTGLCPREST
jgi:hypothetical protein